MDKLDALLEFVRDPHPSDEYFVRGTMAHLRAADERRARRRRLYTRPTALAAAVVIIIGGAVAAVVRTGNEAKQNVAVDTTPRQTVTARPGSTGAGRRPQDAAPAEQGSTRESEMESGYASRNTAYTVDHETGLRLQTKIAKTQIDTGVPQTVTVTLTNTGARELAVSAPRGCALMVGAYLADDRSRAADEPAHPWQCATTSDESTTQPDERFVMEPGDTLIGEATIVLGAAGDWGLVGMCRCTYRPADEPTPKPGTDDPLDDLPPVMTTLSPLLRPQDQPAEESSEGLVTPPIRVRAS